MVQVVLMDGSAVVQVVVIEREKQLGGVWWKNQYPRVGLQSPAEMWELPDFPFPAGTPKYPSGSQVKATSTVQTEVAPGARLFGALCAPLWNL